MRPSNAAAEASVALNSTEVATNVRRTERGIRRWSDMGGGDYLRVKLIVPRTPPFSDSAVMAIVPVSPLWAINVAVAPWSLVSDVFEATLNPAAVIFFS